MTDMNLTLQVIGVPDPYTFTGDVALLDGLMLPGSDYAVFSPDGGTTNYLVELTMTSFDGNGVAEAGARAAVVSPRAVSPAIEQLTLPRTRSRSPPRPAVWTETASQRETSWSAVGLVM